MADDGWDVHDAISTATPTSAPSSTDDDGWDVHDAVGAPAPPSTSAYEAAGGRSTWGDVLQGGIAGLHGAAATAAGAVASLSDEPQEGYWRGIAHRQAAAVGESEKGMTPAAQAPGFTKHPLVSLTEGAPGVVAIGVPAAIGTAVAGPVGGALAGAGAMGLQTRGDVYNRLTGEGIEPTSGQLAGATALGVATGLATEPVGALVGKAAVSPIVKRALGLTGEATVFGASSGAQEYSSQKDEIAAGVRKDLDPSAMWEATVSGAEVGAGFNLFGGGGRHSGVQRDPAQTGGKATIPRTPAEQRATEAKPRAATAAPADPTAGASTPTSPVADPAVATAAKGQPTPRVGEQPGVAPTPSVQPGPVASQTAPEGAQTGETAPPPPPPPGGAEASAAPGPAPPPPPPPAVPPEVLARQHGELIDPAHPRDAMVYPKGIKPSDILANKGKYGSVKLPDGRTVVYDHDYNRGQWKKATVLQAALDGTLEGKIEAQANKPRAPESVAGAQPAAAGEAPVQGAPAAAETAAAPPQSRADQIKDAAERGEFKQEPSVEPTSESKPAGPELLATNKAGIKLYRNPDPKSKPYLKVTPDGKSMEMGEETAKLLFHEHFGAEAYTGGEKSETEKVREAEQAELERMRQAREKVATLSTKDEVTGEETAKPRPEAGARVLRAEDEGEQRAQQAQALADKAAAEKVATEQPAVKPVKPKEDQKASKDRKRNEAQAAANKIAGEIVDRHPPKEIEAKAIDPSKEGGKGARAALISRIKEMLEDAKGKYDFLASAKHRIDEEARHSNKALILYEAKLLLGKGAKAKTEDYMRFLHNEHRLLTGGQEAYDEVMGLRKQTGRERAAERGMGVKETGVEDVETTKGTEAVERADEAHERELTNAQIAREKFLEAKKANEERLAAEKKARDDEQEALRKEAELAKRTLPGKGEIISPARGKVMDEEGGKELKVVGDEPAKLFEHMTVPEFREYMQSLHDSLPDGSVAKQGAKDQLGTIDRSANWEGSEGKANYPPPDARQNIVDHIRLEHNAEVRRKAAENPWKTVSEALQREAGAKETSPGVWRATIDGKVLGDSRGYKTRSEAMDEAEHIVKQDRIAKDVAAEEKTGKTIDEGGKEVDEPFTPQSRKMTDEEKADQRALERNAYDERRAHLEKMINNPLMGERQKAHLRSELAKLKLDWEARERERPANTLKEGEGYSAGKTQTKGFTVAKVRPKFKKEEAPLSEDEIKELHGAGWTDDEINGYTPDLARAKLADEQAKGPPDEGEVEVDGRFGRVKIRPIRVSDAATAIKENHDTRRYVRGTPQIMDKLRDLIVKIAGDVKVYYVDSKTMLKLVGSTPRGMYHHGDGIILLNVDNMYASTPLHEAYHAAVAIGLKRQPYLRDLMDRLRLEVLDNMPKDIHPENYDKIYYYLTDHEEFVNGLMTHPLVQELLKGVKISKELAKDIGIPRWRKATMWEGALSIIRQLLGLKPHETSAIEAAMALSEEAMLHDPRAAGELMQASGRLHMAEAKEALQKKWAREGGDDEKVVKFPGSKIEPLTDEERRMITDMGWTRAELKEMTPVEARRHISELHNLPKTNREEAKRWNEYLSMARGRRDYLEDLDNRQPRNYQEGVDKRNMEFNLKEVKDAIDDVVDRLYALHEQDWDTLGLPKHDEPTSANENRPRGSGRADRKADMADSRWEDDARWDELYDKYPKFIHDPSSMTDKEFEEMHKEFPDILGPPSDEEHLLAAGWDHDAIKKLMDTGTPEEIAKAVEDAKTTFNEQLVHAGVHLDPNTDLSKLINPPEAHGPPRPNWQQPNRRMDAKRIALPIGNGRYGWYINVRSNTTVREMLQGIMHELGVGTLKSGDLAKEFAQRLIDLVGDMPVRYVSKKELYDYYKADGDKDPRGSGWLGFYHFNTHQIVIHDQNALHEDVVHTKFHEAVHAATSVALEKFPEFRKQIRQLMDASEKLGAKEYFPYAFTNEGEYVAEALSNKAFREGLAERSIPNDLKKQIDYAAWRKLTGFKRALKTMWDLTALAIGKALKLPPRGVSFLEAVLAATEPHMEQHAKDVASGKRVEWLPRKYQADMGKEKGPYPTLSREEGGPLIQAGKLRPAGLYEPDQAPKGTKFVHVQLGPGLKRFYRVMDESRTDRASLKPPPERDQDAAVRSHQETWAKVKDLDHHVALQYGKDTIHNLGGSVMRGTAKALSGTWLNDIHGHLFTDAKGKILDAINLAQNSVSHAYTTLMSKDKDTINRGYMLDKIYASHMAAYAHLVDMSVRYNIHADKASATPPKNLWDAARNAWQQFKYGDEARAIYDHLPEDLQKRYVDEQKFYSGKQSQAGKIMIERLMPMFDAPKGRTSAEVLELARKNALEDADWNHYQKLGVADVLHEAYRLQSKKDFYANSQRGDGRFVVTGKYAMPKGGKDVGYDGDDLRDDTREFNTEQEAHAYATGTRMKSTTRAVEYYKDPSTGEIKQVSGDEAASIGTTETKYRVRLERQNYQTADSRAEARRNRQAMEADGVGELTGVMDRRDERAWSDLNTADQKLIERKIDANTNWSDFEKRQMKDISRQMMLASRGGMGAHMIQARKVAGARFDTAAGLHAYARAANYHIARNEHAPAIDDAMDRLDAHERANRTDDPENALRRSIVANEYMDRVYGKNASPLGSKVSPFFHRLMTWAFVNFLARPSHILLSQVHPYIYSVPMMAARHGYWKSLQGQYQAMKDLGGMGHNLWEGAKAGYQVYKSGSEQNIDKAVAMAHGVDPILRMINGLKDKDERDAMMRMWESEHLHSAFDASVFEGSGQDRMNAVIRQFTDAMEANNRLSTALNAYRLEKAMHKDPGNALGYSRRVIEQTHGVFSPTNAASVFKNPIMRGVMQFRQQPMNLAISMYRNMGKALPEKMGGSGDNEARWTLAYQLATAAALGGMGGMPMDLPKLIGIGGQALGGPSPSDWDDKFYRTLESNLGPNIAKFVHDGVPGLMGPYGPSIGHRAGWDAGMLFGEPKSDSADDLFSYAAKNFAGASVGMGMDWLNALHQAEQGNWERAGEYMMPGSLKDFLKVYRNATQGQMAGKSQVSPPSFGHELLQGLGFSSVNSERLMSGHFALQKEVKAQQTVTDQLKAKRSREKSVLGVKIPKKQRALGEEYENAYQ